MTVAHALLLSPPPNPPPSRAHRGGGLGNAAQCLPPPRWGRAGVGVSGRRRTVIQGDNSQCPNFLSPQIRRSARASAGRSRNRLSTSRASGSIAGTRRRTPTRRWTRSTSIAITAGRWSSMPWSRSTTRSTRPWRSGGRARRRVRLLRDEYRRGQHIGVSHPNGQPQERDEPDHPAAAPGGSEGSRSRPQRIVCAVRADRALAANRSATAGSRAPPVTRGTRPARRVVGVHPLLLLLDLVPELLVEPGPLSRSVHPAAI